MGQLTEDQWLSLLPWLKRIKPPSLAAAHGVLVEGKSFRTAAAEAGLPYYQQVHDTVKRILRWQQRVRANTVATPGPLPAGWVTVCFDLPKKQVPAARRLIGELCAKSGQKKERKVVGKHHTRRSP
jgi:hypothetical protein